MSEPDQLEKHHKQSAFIRWKYTWYGRLTWTLVDLAIAYAFFSLAIDSGALWQWGIAILFLINGLYNLIRFIGRVIHGSSNKQ